MPNMTLAIPADLKSRMDNFPEINWSEVARQAIAMKTQTLEAMGRLLSRSALTEADAISLGRKVKFRAWKKHRRPA